MKAASFLLVVTVAYRVAMAYLGVHTPWLENFAPISAIALCGAMFFPRRIALILPLAIFFLSDLILNAHYGVALLSPYAAVRYLVLALVGLIGYSLRGRATLVSSLVAACGGSLLFYVVTNTMCWFTNAFYTKDLAGWVQSLTVGVPGYPPTWTFFRSSLLSDLAFTAIFFGCVALSRRTEQPTPLTVASQI